MKKNVTAIKSNPPSFAQASISAFDIFVNLPNCHNHPSPLPVSALLDFSTIFFGLAPGSQSDSVEVKRYLRTRLAPVHLSSSHKSRWQRNK
jgi:hypothetical protein